jgi:hypothetical protein
VVILGHRRTVAFGAPTMSPRVAPTSTASLIWLLKSSLANAKTMLRTASAHLL